MFCSIHTVPKEVSECRSQSYYVLCQQSSSDRGGPDLWFQDRGRSGIKGRQLAKSEVALTESYAEIEHDVPPEHLLQ